MEDHEICDDNVKNMSFKLLLSIHNLRDEDEIIKIFEAGEVFGVSKSAIKGWRTDPTKNKRGSIMPNVAFYGFVWGLKAWQIEGKLKNNPFLEK